MRSFLLVSTLLFSGGSALLAQTTVFEGHVRTTTGAAPAMATVRLLDSNAASVNRGMGDSAGRYAMTALQGRRYRIRAVAPGCDTALSEPVLAAGDTTLVPALLLLPAAQGLGEVTVRAAPRFYEMKPDRLVINLAGSPLTTGATLFEVLRQAPGISADQDDNLRMKGGAVRIYINGRPSFLTGAQLNNYLKALPADMAATVELISQPSGRYEAAGTAGIINIVLKKNKSQGLNGTLSLGGGMGRYPKANAGLSLNYRKGKLNLFGNIDPGYSESYNRLDYNSVIAGKSPVYQERRNYWNPRTRWAAFAAGADYDLNERSVLGVLLNGERTIAPARTDNSTVFRNAEAQPFRFIDSRRTDNTANGNLAVNVNYKLRTDSAGGELTVNADLGSYAAKGTDVNENVFRDGARTELRPDYIFRQIQRSDISLVAGTIDYTRSVRGLGKLELGAKWSLVDSDNDLRADSVSVDHWSPDPGRSNRFRYREQIVAGYVNWARRWNKKTALQLGLRAEHTDGTGSSPTLGLENSVRYFNLFPTAYLSRRLDSNHSLNFSYGRRINRPSYQSLNPFEFYLDPYTRFAGNPYLSPSFAHSFELKHGYRQLLFSTLSYRYSRREAIMTIGQDRGSGLVTNMTRNAGVSQYLGLELFNRLTPRPWWTVENSLTLAATRSGSDIPGYSFDTRALSAYGSTNHTFTIRGGLRLQTSFYCSAPTREGLARLREAYGLSLGAQQQLWKQRATIRLNVNNIVGINAYRAHYLGEGLDIRWRNEWEGRKISLSFDYRFGSRQIKAARERQTATDEKSRMGI